jgi:hypothetical protein
MKTIFFSFLVLTLLASCKDEHSHEPVNPDTVVLTLNSPKAGDVFGATDTVKIRGSVTNTTGAELHGYSITLKKNTDNTILFNKTQHAHGATLSFDEIFVNNNQNSTITLEISVAIDHDGNKTNKNITFTCQ